MKRNFSFALIIFCAAIIFFGCKKNDNPGTGSNPTVPILSTTAASNITSSSAQTGGSITSDGGSDITARGVCWRELSEPTITDSHTTDGTGSGTFTSIMTNLMSNRVYHVRAYATNATGTGYGNEIIVGTSNGVPSITTQSVVATNNKWTGGGSNIWRGGADIIQKGVCWSTTPNPTIANTKTTEGSGSNGFSSRILLTTNATTYVRAYATNSYGTGYGSQITVTTAIAIGLLHGGGMIYHVDASGQHGLIAALSDFGNNIPWAPGALFTTTTNATSVTNGAANTTQIINVYGNTGYYAAKLCRDYNGGGFNDWFLPATDQAFILQGYQDIVGGFNPPIFLGTYNYWSSTENNNFRAWDLNFNYFNSFNNPQKNQLNYVRAVRAF